MSLSVQASTRSARHARAVRAQRVGVPARTSTKICLVDRRRHQLSGFVVQAEPEKTPTDGSAEFDKLLKDLQEKWDAVENKTTVAVYGGASVVVLWFASAIVSAVNSVPLLPKLLELVGLGYTAWFVYRYLLFKSSREELVADVEELKKKISGTD